MHLPLLAVHHHIWSCVCACWQCISITGLLCRYHALQFHLKELAEALDQLTALLSRLLRELPSNAVALKRVEQGKSAASQDAIQADAAVMAAAWGHKVLNRVRRNPDRQRAVRSIG